MYACSCCQKAVLTSSLHHHLFTVHDPHPTIPPETTIPNNDCVSCTRLTTLHLTIYWGGDNCALCLITPKWHHWKLTILALSVKSEAQGICAICVLERGSQKLHLLRIGQSNRSVTSFIPPFTSSLDIITDLTMVDRQKPGYGGKVTLENLFIEQLMSNKQLLNEGGLSHWDRRNSLYLEGGSLGLTELCGKSKSWCLLDKAAVT